MGYNIPEKIFDQHMHIVRDVHFDVDEYKVNELYVIRHTISNAHTVDGKMIGKLIKAEPDALTFDIFTKVTPKDIIILPTDPHNYYSIETITLFIDDIIEKKIEIERLMTESEADFRTANIVSVKVEPECKSVLADKYKGDLSIYAPLLRTPNPSPFDQMILSSKSRLKSDIQAAYKINNKEEAEDLAENSMLKIAEEVYDSSLDEYRNYTVDIPEMGEPFSFVNINWKFNTKAFENLCGKIEVAFRKGSNQIRFNTSNKFIFVTEDTIRILNKSGLNVTIYNNDFRESFDKIEFKVIQ